MSLSSDDNKLSALVIDINGATTVYLSTKTRDQKRFASQMIASGLFIGVILLVVLLIIGFPTNLWTPARAGEFLRCVLSTGLIFCASMILMGISEFIEDREVQYHSTVSRSNEPIYNPVSFGPGLLALLGFITSIVLALKYLFLFLNPRLHIDSLITSFLGAIARFFSTIPPWFWTAVVFTWPMILFSLLTVSLLCAVLFDKVRSRHRAEPAFKGSIVVVSVFCILPLVITILLGRLGITFSESESLNDIPPGYPWIIQIIVIVLFFHVSDRIRRKNDKKKAAQTVHKKRE